MPSQELATGSTAENQCVKSLWMRHAFLRVALVREMLA